MRIFATAFLALAFPLLAADIPGVVEGRVLTPSGDPVMRAIVRMGRPKMGWPLSMFLTGPYPDQFHGGLYHAVAAADGSYRIKAPPGKYEMAAFLPAASMGVNFPRRTTAPRLGSRRSKWHRVGWLCAISFCMVRRICRAIPSE